MRLGLPFDVYAWFDAFQHKVVAAGGRGIVAAGGRRIVATGGSAIVTVGERRKLVAIRGRLIIVARRGVVIVLRGVSSGGRSCRDLYFGGSFLSSFVLKVSSKCFVELFSWIFKILSVCVSVSVCVCV